MKEITGTVFSLARDNPPVQGCTVSKEIYQGYENYITHFSLAEKTDISAELYEYHKVIVMLKGYMTVTAGDNKIPLKKGECIITPVNIPVGMTAGNEAIYTEIGLRRNSNMNKALKAGEVFNLGGLVPYQDGKIVNMDIASNEKMKFVVMSFDKGTGLAEHAAPGEALIFALDGEGIIGYEGKEHILKAGENFKFAKNGKHYVKANSKFKMALLLTLE